MLKIAITGAESSGKSELARALSVHFRSPYVPEYAREYVENLGRKYDFSDVCSIAKKQIEQELFYENDFSQKADFVFFDTELIITKVWFEHCYGTVPDFLIERLTQGFFDFYLLCAPDLAWQADGVRENGNKRDFFFDRYRHEIELLGKPHAIVTGKNEERTLNAIEAVRRFYENKIA
jgi:nicotinamide riboside kinase